MSSGDRVPDRKVILVGNPNVGKSVIFKLLTGSYVLVSNFPGTTVEVSRCEMQMGGITYEVVDTPGVNSLVPQSEDERVTCEILLREEPDVIVQVADAKNLRRTLLVTSQLVEFGIPMVLVLNMIDEAEERGVEIDVKGLSEFFGMPLVETVAIYSRGRRQLIHAIQNPKAPKNRWGSSLEGNDVFHWYSVSERSPSLLALEWLALDDRGFTRTVEQALGTPSIGRLRQLEKARMSASRHRLAKDVESSRNGFLRDTVAAFKKKRKARFVDTAEGHAHFWLVLLIIGLILFGWNEVGGLVGWATPFSVTMQFISARLASAPGSSSGAVTGFLRDMMLCKSTSGRYEFGLVPEAIHFLLLIAPVIIPFGVLLVRSRNFVHEFGILTRRAATGIPILIAVLLLVYEFVGYTGAQTLVGLLEKTLFGGYLIPLLRRLMPSGFIADLITGKYGLVSMGLTYALAIVLPVVSTFFIAFSLLEDSGYLPRLAILSDRVMRAMGLNGKATLPMVLGLGCCTMATMTTRILNSRKERLIATLLLALGVPCSAQLGVILGIAAGFSSMATLTVIGVVASQLLLVGYLSSLLIGGKRSEFIFEIPPIRVPQLRNVMLKTGCRIQWYLKEAVPLFLYGTLALFTLDRLYLGGRSLMEWLQAGLAPVLTGILHLPAQAAGVFVLGFLRRDYGAAGLFEMTRTGALSAQQAVVSLIVVTLFVPCLASFLMIAKEQGLKRALAITTFIIPFAVSVGAVVSWFVRTFNIQFQ
ncbi:MAG TPA: ferrous iron transporter B [Acidobacteriota bacterium]|nr:ferrous iron transporter B [Acidobacteriota bacterium]